MHRTHLAALAVVAASLAPFPAAGSTSPWDLIYTDRLDVTLCAGCGITLAGKDFALLVNTGPASIEAGEFFGATFSVVSSHPDDVVLHPFINNPGQPVAPILLGEAVGSVIATDDAVSGPNAILLTALESGETHRNTATLQVIAFHIERKLLSTFEGPVQFEVEMMMGDRAAMFTIGAEVHLGEHMIAFPSANRVRSMPMATPVIRRTWGELKKLYR